MNVALGAPAHARAIIESSEDAIISKDREALVTSWNPAAERLYGWKAEEVIGRPISVIVPEHLKGEELEILERIAAGERLDHYEAERVRKDGTPVFVSLTVSPINDDAGEVAGAAVIARDITEQRRAQERADRLQRLTASLAREVSLERAANLVLDEAMPALGADAGAVSLLSEDGGTVAMMSRRGYSKQGVEKWQEFPVTADVPVTEAMREDRPVWAGRAADLERYRDLAGADIKLSASAILPLSVENQVLGAIALSFRDEREFNSHERAFLLAASQQAANAVARARLRESERRARDRLAFLAQASEVLASSLDLDTTLRRLARVAVPALADWCAVHLDDGDVIRTAAVAHVDPGKARLAEELAESFPARHDESGGVAQVIRTGEAQLITHVTDEMLAAGARGEEHLRVLREMDFCSAIIVPLVAGGGTRGAVTLVTSESEVRFGSEDLRFAGELARHAGFAVENAERFSQQRNAAITLQRALLPARIPSIPGTEFAVRYLPAGLDAEAGGDWYDVIDLGDGTAVISIGDVAGTGIAAASVMGRLRTAIRAYALEGHPPDGVIGRLHGLMGDFEDDQMATIFYLRIDPTTGFAEYTRAGHPPALVREPDGTVRELAGAGAPPVGILRELDLKTATTTVVPGSLLLLYTDGLIERRSERLDLGLEQLKATLAEAPAETVPCIDFLVRRMAPQADVDDVALLVARVKGAQADGPA